MLILPGEEKGLIKSNIIETILSSPDLVIANNTFLSKINGVSIPTQTPNLCVLQGEQALVRNFPDDFVIGSVDATTCLIAVILSKQEKWAWATHFDSPELASNPDAFPSELFAQSDKEYDVYLLGGFSDNRRISIKICSAVLRFLCNLPIHLTIRLACFLGNNTSDVAGGPLALNLAVSCADGSCSPSFFEDRGPEVTRRQAFQLVCSLNRSAMRFRTGGCRKEKMDIPTFPVNVYDTESNRLVLPEFPVPRLKYFPGLRENFEEEIALDDADFLQECSTSPEFEPPHFVADIKATRRYVLDLDSALENGPLEFQYVARSVYENDALSERKATEVSPGRRRRSLWRKLA